MNVFNTNTNTNGKQIVVTRGKCKTSSTRENIKCENISPQESKLQDFVDPTPCKIMYLQYHNVHVTYEHYRCSLMVLLFSRLKVETVGRVVIKTTMTPKQVTHVRICQRLLPIVQQPQRTSV